MLKALLIVFKQAVQRMTAAGGGKDEESFTNDANGALCYERPAVNKFFFAHGRSSGLDARKCVAKLVYHLDDRARKSHGGRVFYLPRTVETILTVPFRYAMRNASS